MKRAPQSTGPPDEHSRKVPNRRPVEPDTPRPSRRRTWTREAVALAICVATAISLTWPLAAKISDGIPLGTETVATVPLVSLWSLWWNADRMAHGYTGYWDAPIFHPAERAFGFSETHFIQGGLAAALHWATGSWASSYNVILLVALSLNGFAAYRLLLTLGTRFAAALGGGVLVVALPYVHQELGVLALVPVWGILVSLLAASAFVDQPSMRRGLLLGVAVGASYLLSGYYGIMAGLLLALTLPFLLWRKLRDRKLWIGIAAGMAAAAVLVLPLALPQRDATRAQGFERSEATAAKHSARPVDYVEAAWPTLTPAPGGIASKPSQRAFWPGTVRCALALLGGAWLLASRGRRRWGLWLVALTFLAVILSLGPHGAVGPLSAHDLLRKTLPGYSQMRALFRFAVFAQIGVTLFAAFGIESITRIVRSRIPALAKVATFAVPAFLTVIALTDFRPRMGEILPLPDHAIELAWVEWIEQEAPDDAVFAFVPFPSGRGSVDYLGTAQWMYWQMRHERRMVNGYSSFFPKSFRDLKRDMAEFPTEASIARLDDYGVEYVVVHRAFFPRDAAGQGFGGRRLTRVMRDDETGIDILRVERDRISRTRGYSDPTDSPGSPSAE